MADFRSGDDQGLRGDSAFLEQTKYRPADHELKRGAHGQFGGINRTWRGRIRSWAKRRWSALPTKVTSCAVREIGGAIGIGRATANRRDFFRTPGTQRYRNSRQIES